MVAQVATASPTRYSLKIVSSRHIAGVPVTHVATADKYYHGRRFRIERRFVRLFTNFLQWYLEKNSHMAFESRVNLTRYLVYLPSGMRAWRAYMPGGFATYHVHNPQRVHMQNGKKLDLITRAFFRHTYDAVNVRSRAYIMDWLTCESLLSVQGPRCWVSLAGGSGQPVFDVFNELSPDVRKLVALTIVDRDKAMLHFAAQVYKAHNLPIQRVDYLPIDVMESKELNQLLAQRRPQIVDAMGLFEYLSDAGCIRLLRTVYQQLPRGGVFVYTNMWSKRPHLDVHQRALGWPGVAPRSIHDVLALMKEARIPLSAQAVYHDDDKVYCVYRVVKQ
jgi:hypothetical protein